MVDKVFLRTAYNYDTDKASLESGLQCEEESKTQQQFKEECDINVIVRRFGLTGEVPQGWQIPKSGDFTDTVNDFQTAMNMIKLAEESFMQVPGEIRARFDHDAGALMKFLEDENNYDEALKLGLVEKRQAPVEPEPVLVRMAEPPKDQ